MTLRAAVLLAAMLALAGCAAFKSQDSEREKPAMGVKRTAPANNGAPTLSVIPSPSIPPDLASQAKAATRAQADDDRKYTYTLDCQSSADPTLAETFEKVSRLALMREDGAVTMATLEQRLSVSLEDGRSILRNRGYYEGEVTGRLTPESGDKVKAVIRFTPGPAYALGSARVILSGPLDAKSEAAAPPKSLADVGLASGEPAATDDILAAVKRVEAAFRNRGYPRATVEATRYVVDKKSKTLDAEIHIDPKGFARMGDLEVPEDATVDRSYLEAQRTWQVGQPWNQELLDNYLTTLRQTGLFQSVEGRAVREDDPSGLRPVRLRLAGAPERTVGGMLSYDTDFGPGVQAYWEHRNLTGHGDRLRIDLPVWQDMQELTASYRYPFFMRPDQDFIAQAGLYHEDTDAYKLWSGALAAGVERRLTPHWRVGAMGSVEGGSLEDPGQPKKEFLMFGLPLSATYDSTNSLLDPTRGARLITQVAPYTGTFHSEFNVVRTRVEGQSFLPLGSERLVMALRGVWGSVWNADNSQDLPSSLRFYSGGGGSVRGYDYQSVGPRNDKNDPLGGVSQVEVGAETRWRFREDMGVVAFLDGGMVYENVADKLFQDMLWGAGLGYRYYTAIGPVRVDVAVPLDRRPDDDSWQLYMSLGQAF